MVAFCYILEINTLADSKAWRLISAEIINDIAVSTPDMLISAATVAGILSKFDITRASMVSKSATMPLATASVRPAPASKRPKAVDSQ